ncbi:MAG: CD3072 family TudS-related putative desulfidase [Clostridia bacterium]
MDNRYKKIVVLAHCLSNTNAKTGGYSPQKCGEIELLQILWQNNCGMMQLPCPEHRVYGSKRWGQGREQFSTPFFRKACRKMLIPYIDELEDYFNSGYQIVGIIGVNGSPSCGMFSSYSNPMYGGELSEELLPTQLQSGANVTEPGIFMQEFKLLLLERKLAIPLFDFREEDRDKCLQELTQIFEKA